MQLWNRLFVEGRAVRMSVFLMIAVAVSLASMAFSEPVEEKGITSLGISEAGDVYAFVSPDRDIRYISRDGGLTWTPKQWNYVPVTIGGWGVQTPRGRYKLEGPNILLVDPDGRQKVVYSTNFLTEGANGWKEAEDTRHHGERRIGSDPYRVVYDSKSGNVIVALGLQGVVVGTPDGSWKHARVGPYSPTDFSFESKTRTLISSLEFWTIVIVLSVSWAGTALALSRSRTIVNWKTLPMALIVGAILLVMFLIFFSIPGLNLFVPVLVALGIWEMHQRNEWRTATLISISGFALITSGALVLMFGGSDAKPESVYTRWFFPFSMAAFALAIASMAVSWRLLTYWRTVMRVIALAAVIVVAMFFVWLHTEIPGLLVKLAIFALPAIFALRLRNQVKEETVRDVVLCPKCEFENQPTAIVCTYCDYPLREKVRPHC